MAFFGLLGWASDMHRYLLSGLVTVAVDFGVFQLLNQVVGLWYLHAHVVSRSAGAITCFLLNYYFTFAMGDRSMLRRATRFVALWAVSFALSSLLVFSFVEGFDLAPFAGKVTAECLVFLFNYSVMKYWVMKREVSNGRAS
jgi:putative flippase GtrA